MSQFDKMVRNSRQSGAHNRFYRAQPRTVEALVAEIVDALANSEKRRVIPEFVDRFSLQGRSSGGLPNSLFIPMSEFIDKYSDRGTIYHGTPNGENAFAIFRQGLIISSSQQGAAMHGRGAYASKDLSVARDYGRSGIVFALQVRQDVPVRILDWKLAASHPAVLFVQAKLEGRDVFEMLARDYGVDIIVNNHVLIQNLNAVRLPAPSLKEFLMPWIHQARDKTLPLSTRFRALVSFRELQPLSIAAGENTPDAEAVALELFSSPANNGQLADLLLEVQRDNHTDELLKYPQIIRRFDEAILREMQGYQLSSLLTVWSKMRRPEIFPDSFARFAAADFGRWPDQEALWRLLFNRAVQEKMGRAPLVVQIDRIFSAQTERGKIGLLYLMHQLTGSNVWLESQAIRTFILETGKIPGKLHGDEAKLQDFKHQILVRLNQKKYPAQEADSLWRWIMEDLELDQKLKDRAFFLEVTKALQDRGGVDVYFRNLPNYVRGAAFHSDLLQQDPTVAKVIQDLLTYDRQDWSMSQSGDVRKALRSEAYKNIPAAKLWYRAAAEIESGRRRAIMKSYVRRAIVTCQELLSVWRAQKDSTSPSSTLQPHFP